MLPTHIYTCITNSHSIFCAEIDPINGQLKILVQKIEGLFTVLKCVRNQKSIQKILRNVFMISAEGLSFVGLNFPSLMPEFLSHQIHCKIF